MARFLFTTWYFRGHFFPLVPIAAALQSRGHDVRFYTGPDAVPTLEGIGFQCFPFRHVDSAKLNDIVYSPDKRGSWASVTDGFRFRKTLKTWLVDTIHDQVRDVQAILAEWKPDVIVSEPTMWGSVLILHELQTVPVGIMSFVPAYMVPGPDLPLFGPGFPPPRTARARFAARSVKFLVDRLASSFRKSLNEIRRSYGLPDLTMSATEYTGTLPVHILPSVPEFDYERTDVPPTVHYVGFCIWTNPGHIEDPPAILQAPKTNPWIHVTEGTFHIRRHYLMEAAMRGLANEDLTVVLTGGGQGADGLPDPSTAPDNVVMEDWIAHDDLMPRVDVLLTTGGGGTVCAALRFGVPMVVVPGDVDKLEIAQRIVQSGIGIWIKPRKCTPERLREAVLEVLRNPSYRENALRLRDAFSSSGGPDAAADLLEALVPGDEGAAPRQGSRN